MSSGKLMIATVRGTERQREALKAKAHDARLSINEFVLRMLGLNEVFVRHGEGEEPAASEKASTSVLQAAELAESQSRFAESLAQGPGCPLFHVENGEALYRRLCIQAADLLRQADGLLEEGRPAAARENEKFWTRHLAERTDAVATT